LAGWLNFLRLEHLANPTWRDGRVAFPVTATALRRVSKSRHPRRRYSVTAAHQGCRITPQGGTGVTVGKIPLGITGDDVALGSHLVHFWKTDDEFESGVRFLQLGIDNPTEYSVLFGHDEANERVLEILRRTHPDLDHALRQDRLVILRRDSSASVTLAKIKDAFSSAVRKGATAIRYLGNLGIGRDALPGRGASEVIELETGVTALAHRYPCVMVCMYDVNTVSGHLLLASGFATHPLAVWNDQLKQNPYCDCEEVPSSRSEEVA
jgi:hypothetical protein